MLLPSRVRDLEHGTDVYEMRILHTYDYLTENHSLVQFQQIEIEGLEQRMKDLELRLVVPEISAVTIEVMISCLQHQLAQFVAWVMVYFGMWQIVQACKAGNYIFGLNQGKVV